VAANPGPTVNKIAARTAVLLDSVLRKTIAIANERFAGTAGDPIPKAQNHFLE
jgi:hypothetical protein